MKPSIFAILLQCAALSLGACSGPKEEKAAAAKPQQLEMTENYVDTMHLRATDFNHQVVCNGKLQALVKSQLAMRHPDPIVKIAVTTGQRVAKGQLLATSEEENYQRALAKAQRDYEKAEIEFADKLISLGYDNAADMPADMRKRAEITSGLSAAKHELEKARQDLADCSLYAPVSGRIADLEGKLYQKGDKFCTIIDESAFDVDFNVLETELPQVAVGNEADVVPFATPGAARKGRITAINPTVSDKGLVGVTARVPGGDQLLDGMNVKVVVQRTQPGMLVVPKDAVVERDGYYVVFVYRDGQAVWTYVDILASNLTQHAITGCAAKQTTINEGDVIITSGNMNLADGTRVQPKGK